MIDPGAPVVELRDVFRVHRSAEGDAAALRGATLQVRAGELVAVIGPSGAGKSTLLRVIAGLERPSAGDARLGVVDIGRLGERRRAWVRREEIGFLGQELDAILPGELSVREAIALPLALRRVSRRDALSRADALLARVGLQERGAARPGTLSGGERQRAALCAAIVHRPPLLLADEPTAELDASAARGLRGLIAELVAERGMAALVVSHDPATAAEATRTLVIRDGRVAEVAQAGRGGLVVDADGWVRLPSELRAAAGIADRVEARIGADGVMLAPASDIEAAADAPAAPEPSAGPSAGAPAGRPDAPIAVTIDGVSRMLGRRLVLDRLSAAPPPGRLTVVRGRSGAGKSTLLRLIAGLDRPDHGEVRLEGDRISELGAEERAAIRARRIGYLAQEPFPVGFLSAEENVALALALRGVDRAAALREGGEAIALLGLRGQARRPVARLSAGERQRVALARALACAGGLLVLDEPTSRLDRAGAAAVAELLAALRDRHTVICATHDPLVARRADHVIELERETVP